MSWKETSMVNAIYTCLTWLKQPLPVWASRRTDWGGSSARREPEPRSCPLRTRRRRTPTPRSRSADKQRSVSSQVRSKTTSERTQMRRWRPRVLHIIARCPATAFSERQRQRPPLAQTCYISAPRAMHLLWKHKQYVHLPSSHILRDLYRGVGRTPAQVREKAFADQFVFKGTYASAKPGREAGVSIDGKAPRP